MFPARLPGARPEVVSLLESRHQVQPAVLPRREPQRSEHLMSALLLLALLLPALPEALAVMGPASSSLRSALRRT